MDMDKMDLIKMTYKKMTNKNISLKERVLLSNLIDELLTNLLFRKFKI